MSDSAMVTAGNDGEAAGGELEVAIMQMHPIVMVRIVGDVVVGTDPLLRSVFETVMGVDVPAVEVDLARARLFDSHGLAALEEVCSAVLCHGRSLVLRGIGIGAGGGGGISLRTGVLRGIGSQGSRDGVGVQAGLAR